MVTILSGSMESTGASPFPTSCQPPLPVAVISVLSGELHRFINKSSSPRLPSTTHGSLRLASLSLRKRWPSRAKALSAPSQPDVAPVPPHCPARFGSGVTDKTLGNPSPAMDTRTEGRYTGRCCSASTRQIPLVLPCGEFPHHAHPDRVDLGRQVRRQRPACSPCACRPALPDGRDGQ